MDYSELKDALSLSPQNYNPNDGLTVREFVMVEALKALIQANNAKDLDPNTDIQIKRNINTACKYAGAFMNARYFFNNCYAPGFLLNEPEGWEETVASYPAYPTDAPFSDYGLGTPLFNWEYDYVLSKWSLTVKVDQSFFPLEYGCGWEYCETKLYVAPGVIFGPGTYSLDYFPTSETATNPALDLSVYTFTNPVTEELTRADHTFIDYPSQADLDAVTNGTMTAVNGVGLASPDGFTWDAFPHNYNMDLYNISYDALVATGVIPPPIPSNGGFLPFTPYVMRFGYKCDCSGAEVFGPTYAFASPPVPPYPPL